MVRPVINGVPIAPFDGWQAWGARVMVVHGEGAGFGVAMT